MRLRVSLIISSVNLPQYFHLFPLFFPYMSIHIHVMFHIFVIYFTYVPYVFQISKYVSYIFHIFHIFHIFPYIFHIFHIFFIFFIYFSYSFHIFLFFFCFFSDNSTIFPVCRGTQGLEMASTKKRLGRNSFPRELRMASPGKT